MRDITYLISGHLFLYFSTWETHTVSQGREIKNRKKKYPFMSFSEEVSRKFSSWYRLILMTLEDIFFKARVRKANYTKILTMPDTWKLHLTKCYISSPSLQFPFTYVFLRQQEWNLCFFATGLVAYVAGKIWMPLREWFSNLFFHLTLCVLLNPSETILVP